jgi:hypothetical protein
MLVIVSLPRRRGLTGRRLLSFLDQNQSHYDRR